MRQHVPAVSRPRLCAVLLTLCVGAGQPLAAQPVRAAAADPPASAKRPPAHLNGEAAADDTWLVRDESTSLEAVLSQLGRDFERLVTVRSGVLLALGGGVSLLGRIQERQVANRLARNPGLGRLFGAGELVGGALFQSALAASTYGVGRLAGKPRLARLGADLVRTQIVTQGVTQAIKVTVGRDRPDGTEFSFPSGHSASAFATATVLERHFGWKAGVAAYAFAGYVAASRVQEYRHFTSDVIFGATLGILAGRAVTMDIAGTRFGLTPVTTSSGGLGIGLTTLPLR